jgi:hypothetical protein
LTQSFGLACQRWASRFLLAGKQAAEPVEFVGVRLQRPVNDGEDVGKRFTIQARSGKDLLEHFDFDGRRKIGCSSH